MSDPAEAVLVLHGGRGRMGRAIATVATDERAVRVGWVVGRGDVLPDAPEVGSVLVDFAVPAAFDHALAWARAHRVPFLSGTTGLREDQLRALETAADELPVLYARNMSLGVAVLRRLVRDAAALLGDPFDIEVVEAHHRGKRDAPSGTALALVEAARLGRGSLRLVAGRQGPSLTRPAGEIGVHALRGGSVAGDHTVHFLGTDERIALAHHAEDRRVFARGAVHAARWLVEQPPGRYSMDDVLASRLPAE